MSQRHAPCSNRLLRTRLWVVLLLVGVSASVLSSLAEVGPETEPSPVQEDRKSFREFTKVELTLIEAVVLDRRGRHVRGLPLSSFQLIEGRQEIEIYRGLRARLSGDERDRFDAAIQLHDQTMALNAHKLRYVVGTGLEEARSRSVP